MSEIMQIVVSALTGMAAAVALGVPIFKAGKWSGRMEAKVEGVERVVQSAIGVLIERTVKATARFP